MIPSDVVRRVHVLFVVGLIIHWLSYGKCIISAYTHEDNESQYIHDITRQLGINTKQLDTFFISYPVSLCAVYLSLRHQGYKVF